MSERFKGTGSGKGDKSRVSDYEKYSRNMEKIYEKKSWQFWMVWEGREVGETPFDSSGLEEGEQISYSEFIKRLKK